MGGETVNEARSSKFQNLALFCDVTDPQNDPKWYQNHLKRQETQNNDCFDLKMCTGKYFWNGETDGDVRVPKFNNLDLFSDVTDSKNGPKGLKICSKLIFI